MSCCLRYFILNLNKQFTNIWPLCVCAHQVAGQKLNLSCCLAERERGHGLHTDCQHEIATALRRSVDRTGLPAGHYVNGRVHYVIIRD